MSNKDAPFGARVVGKLGSGVQNGGVTEYEIASGASGNIFSGDLVKMTNTGTILVAAAGDESIGVFRGCTFTTLQVKLFSVLTTLMVLYRPISRHS